MGVDGIVGSGGEVAAAGAQPHAHIVTALVGDDHVGNAVAVEITYRHGDRTRADGEGRTRARAETGGNAVFEDFDLEPLAQRRRTAPLLAACGISLLL